MKAVFKLSVLFAIVILTLALLLIVLDLVSGEQALAFAGRGLATVAVLGVASALITRLTSGGRGDR